MEDLVDNWELIYEMFIGGSMIVDDSIRTEIESHARETYVRENSENYNIRRWLFPGRLTEFNALIENRDIRDIDLTRINERRNREVTIDDLPTWPITEEDVRNDPGLITQIALQLLTNEELNSIEPENLLRAQREAEEEITED